jgi:hypothetical protein
VVPWAEQCVDSATAEVRSPTATTGCQVGCSSRPAPDRRDVVAMPVILAVPAADAFSRPVGKATASAGERDLPMFRWQYAAGGEVVVLDPGRRTFPGGGTGTASSSYRQTSRLVCAHD